LGHPPGLPGFNVNGSSTFRDVEMPFWHL